jgi:hypothetical protein
MGTKNVVETKKAVEITYLPNFRRLVKPLLIFLAVLSPVLASYLISPSNIVVGVITVVSFGIVGLFIFQTIYGLILFKRYFL